MELLERFAAGDLEAFEALFREHHQEVYVWIVRIVRDHVIAEDLTVETFWRFYRARDRFDPAGNFRAWARKIATNAALDHLRTTRRETELPEDLASAGTADQKSFPGASAKISPGGDAGLDRRGTVLRHRRSRGHLHCARQSPRIPGRSNAAQETQFRGRGGQQKMSNEKNNKEMKRAPQARDRARTGHRTPLRPLAANAPH